MLFFCNDRFSDRKFFVCCLTKLTLSFNPEILASANLTLLRSANTFFFSFASNSLDTNNFLRKDWICVTSSVCNRFSSSKDFSVAFKEMTVFLWNLVSFALASFSLSRVMTNVCLFFLSLCNSWLIWFRSCFNALYSSCNFRCSADICALIENCFLNCFSARTSSCDCLFSIRSFSSIFLNCSAIICSRSLFSCFISSSCSIRWLFSSSKNKTRFCVKSNVSFNRSCFLSWRSSFNFVFVSSDFVIL
mmetsp:Transcript_5390/g.7941  ORF Transcript_5390/g.7941 Transcript_5390/m.7941 type:complete len:247 (-) Transcript_5390:148-888(-)